MALYQPTNIIPSSFTQGTVDVNNDMEISWQVNGNSKMTAFQIDFYLNDTQSTFVTSTGKIDKDNLISTGSPLPFYGTDRFGRVQFFTWSPRGQTWEEWSKYQLNNGNNYKFKITQWYEGGTVYSLNNFEFGFGQNYFSFINESGNVAYVSFARPTYPVEEIIYDSETQQLSLVSGNTTINYDSTQSNTKPSNATYLGTAVKEIKIIQNTFSTFITRDAPKLTIQQTDKNYQNAVVLPNTLATSIGYFHADYKQLQDDPIRLIRWQVETATFNTQTNKWVNGEILADTGDIYTPTLNYEFNGFFNGQQYAIKAICESENGLQNDTGWIYFTINIENQDKYEGTFTAQCLPKENATLLEWEGVTVIPPTVSPEWYEPVISNGSVTLPAKTETEEYSVTWDKKLNEKSEEIAMNFPAPWTAVWKGKINLNTEQQPISVSGQVNNQRMFNGELYWYYSDTYTLNPSITKILKVDVTTDSDSTLYEIVPQETESGIRATIYLMTKQRYNAQGYPKLVGAEVVYTFGEIISPKGKTFSLSSGASEIISINQNSNAGVNQFTVTVGGTENIVPIQDLPKSVTFIISPNSLVWYFYLENGGIYQRNLLLSYTQQPITSISIYGGDSGATIDSVSVYNEAESKVNIVDLYKDPTFEPVWNDKERYTLYMTANFNGNLEGGTGTASGNGFRIYRQEVGKNALTPIATVSSRTTSLKDYGIASRKAYKYSLHAYDSNGAFMTAVEAQRSKDDKEIAVIVTCFKNYSLLVCDYDQDNDEYRVRKQYLFALNLSTGSVGNNNSPTLNANFTAYPTRMPSTQNYASGTLQGLIGAIYTVPALIEQIGNYKWTSKPSTMDYFDSVDLEKELYDLSVAPYQLFLRDMKGRLRMIATSGAISMTTNIKQKQQSITISLPWVEIGDASDVTIIQTPDDDGWNNDNQVLDVQLDVDVSTGELSATYPYPYNGTKFYLTGVNKEYLTAKTPNGATPAQFNLSDTATQPTDGQVTATVTVNTENK